MSNEYNLQDKTNPLSSEIHLQRSSSIFPNGEGITSFGNETYDLSRGQNLEGNPPTGLGTPLMGEEGIFSSFALEPGQNNFITVFSTNFRSSEHIAAYSFNGVVRARNTTNRTALIKWNVGWKYIDSTFTLTTSDLDINQAASGTNKVIEPNTVGGGNVPLNYNFPDLVGGNYVNFKMTLINPNSTTQTYFIQGILEYWIVTPFSTS